MADNWFNWPSCNRSNSSNTVLMYYIWLKNSQRDKFDGSFYMWSNQDVPLTKKIGKSTEAKNNWKT